jgi:hypothetical protein
MVRIEPKLAKVNNLGEKLAKVRKENGPASLLHCYNLIDDLNTFSRKYMHGEGKNPDSEQLSVEELRGYVKRTLHGPALTRRSILSLAFMFDGSAGLSKQALIGPSLGCRSQMARLRCLHAGYNQTLSCVWLISANGPGTVTRIRVRLMRD